MRRLSYMIQVGEGTALTTKSIPRRRRSICHAARPGPPAPGTYALPSGAARGQGRGAGAECSGLEMRRRSVCTPVVYGAAQRRRGRARLLQSRPQSARSRGRSRPGGAIAPAIRASARRQRRGICDALGRRSSAPPRLGWTRPHCAPRHAAGSRVPAVAAAASGCAAQRLAAAATAAVWPSARSLSLDFATAVAAGGAAQKLVGLAAH